jgi:hypothetical protein
MSPSARQSSLNSGVYRAVRSCEPLTGFGGVGNDIEYPDGDSGIDLDEVDEALVRSEEIVSFAERLVGHLPVFTP